MAKITIEKLAQMIAAGFREVHDRFDEMQKYMDNRFDRIEYRLGSHDGRLNNLEDQMRVVRNKLGLN
jgi:hypothetical protein